MEHPPTELLGAKIDNAVQLLKSIVVTSPSTPPSSTSAVPRSPPYSPLSSGPSISKEDGEASDDEASDEEKNVDEGEDVEKKKDVDEEEDEKKHDKKRVDEDLEKKKMTSVDEEDDDK